MSISVSAPEGGGWWWPAMASVTSLVNRQWRHTQDPSSVWSMPSSMYSASQWGVSLASAQAMACAASRGWWLSTTSRPTSCSRPAVKAACSSRPVRLASWRAAVAQPIECRQNAFMCKDWPCSFSNCSVSAAAMTRLLSWRIPKILIASRMERTRPDNP